MNKHLKRVLSVLCFVAVCVPVYFVGTAIGKQIYQARYFLNLPAYEGELVESVDDACPLCYCEETNPPCLINLNTGTVRGIRLYDSAGIQSKYVDADKTEYGVMLSGYAAEGASYHSFPDNHYAHIGIERDALRLYSRERAQEFFCESCMEMIEAAEPNCGFLFADCYDRENITLHKLEEVDDGITIRHYTITVESKGEKYMYLNMVSSFFTGNGRELDY